MARFLQCFMVLSLLFVMLAPPVDAARSSWQPYDREAEYELIKEKNIKITMRDGVILVADVYRPMASGRFPVILTQTPYNKENIPGNEYFVRRGYVHVVVDVRGTGGSQGTWQSFGDAEQRDGYELVQWAARQPWSDGNVGLWGASYMAINQFFTAAQHPPALKAIFPIVPMADSYRDIVMSGGLMNTGFIPLWLALTTTTGVLPPTYTMEDPIRGATTVADHATGIFSFQLPTLAETVTGGDKAYDGPYHQSRSPIRVADQIEVPTFIVGGLHDLFQRGEPLLYEKLKENHVQTKLLMGPWNHGNFGSGLPQDGVPTLDSIALRWFDHYLKGMNNRIEEIPDVTQYVLGEGRYEIQPDWPHPQLRPTKMYLEEGNQLSENAPMEQQSPDTMIQNPINGICSGSTNQWLIGLISATPCAKDNRLTELGEITYTTPVMKEDLKFSGPIGAEIWVTTTAEEAVLSVRVTDVAPDGTSTELTAGWLAASLRKVEPEKSRIIQGNNLQPWHPFTKESLMEVIPGKPIKLNIEIFPTNAVIKKGHRLRVSIGPSDFPHAFSTIPQFKKQTGGIIKLLHDPEHPSHVVLPVID